MEIFWKYCRKRLEYPISIIFSNSILWECFPWNGNIQEILWKYFGNKTSIPWKGSSFSSDSKKTAYIPKKPKSNVFNSNLCHTFLTILEKRRWRVAWTPSRFSARSHGEQLGVQAKLSFGERKLVRLKIVLAAHVRVTCSSLPSGVKWAMLAVTEPITKSLITNGLASSVELAGKLGVVLETLQERKKERKIRFT